MILQADAIGQSMEKVAAGSRLPADERSLGVRLECFGSFGDLARRREAWDAFVERVGGDLFSSYDWCELWWKHFGYDRTLMVYVAFVGDAIAAVVPLFHESLRWGPLTLRALRIVGCDHGVTTCNVCVEEEFVDEVVSRIVADVNTRVRWDVLHFGELPGYSENAPRLVQALRRIGGGITVTFDDHAYPHNVFDVPPDFDSFLAALSTKERRNVRHDERELNAVPGLLRQSIADSDELRKGLDDLVKLHGRQWEAQGRLGHFKDWKGIEAFHREVALRLLDRGRLSMQVVYSNEKPLAVEYGGSFGRRLHWIIGARAEGVASRIGFCQLLRSALREGAAQIDALPGEYDYKRRLGARKLQVKTVTVSRRRGASAIRLRAFCVVTRFISFAYYRLWFWHLAPWLRSKFPVLRPRFLVAGIWPRFVRARFLAGARHLSTDETPSRDDRR